MPEFILDPGTAEAASAFKALDALARGYIEAAFFTDCEPGTVRDATDSRCVQWKPDEHSRLPGDMTLADLAPETWSKMALDCDAFENATAGIVLAMELAGHEVDKEKVGRDFWYTRNGHGVGFWEHGRWPEPFGDRLDAAAKAFREVDLYVGDDGKIYQM